MKRSETTQGNDHLAYQGTAFADGKYTEDSNWARVSVHFNDGIPLLEGAYSVDGLEYHIQTDSSYARTRRSEDASLSTDEQPFNVVWRYVDEEKALTKRDDQNTCGLEGPDYDKMDVGLEKRQRWGTGGRTADTSESLIQTIGSTSGCPSTRAIALIGVATDCSYTAQFRSDQEIRRNVLTQVNTASRLYESSFNVELRVRNITITEGECPSSGSDNGLSWNQPCSSGLSISDRLNEFSLWKAGFDDGTAAWSLFTTCNSGSTVGIAWIRSVCQQGAVARGAVRSTPSTNVVAGRSAEWQVFAHELGHNFGAVHDCTQGCGQSSSESLCCPLSRGSCDARGQFMMNPSVNSRMTEFSPCSIGQICSAWGGGNINTACLRGNEDVPTVSESVCGNGVVDEGEDCDCGGEEGCGDNSCCNPTTCRFTEGSVCDPSTQRCCTDQCQLAASGRVCRESLGLCDPEEVCSGSSGDCPRDEQLPDGQTCGDDGAGLTCATGVCTSRAMQCSALLSSNNSTDTVSAANVTADACRSTGCELNCMQMLSSGQMDGMCQPSRTYFRDGTPCGGDSRRCYSGTCGGRSSNNNGGGGGGGSGDVGSWIQRNRTIFIVICVVGGLAVLAGAGFVLSCCLRRVQRRRAIGAQQTRMASAMQQTGAPGSGVSQQAWPPQPAPPLPPSGALSRPGSNLHRWA